MFRRVSGRGARGVNAVRARKSTKTGCRDGVVALVLLTLTGCARAPLPPPSPAPGSAPPADAPQDVDKSRPAHEVYRNIKLFTRDDVSASFFDELMEGISADLGVSCLHCHAEEAYDIDELGPRKRLAREAIALMWRVVGQVNTTYFPGAGGPVRCWTCHRGAPAPERSSLEDEVPPLTLPARESASANGSAGSNRQVLGALGRAELRRTMRTIATSLGVECNACHVEGDRSSDALPRKLKARDMLRMTIAIGRDYFEPGRGPTCWTCHRGSLTVPRARE